MASLALDSALPVALSDRTGKASPARLIEVHPRRLGTLLVALYALLAAWYLVTFARFAFESGLWLGFPVLMTELFWTLLTLVNLRLTLRTWRPAWRRPIRRASVDVFIPTLNEPLEIVHMTVAAALRIRGRRDVYVLDDGRRAALAAMARAMGAIYCSRASNADAKAGNMNAGLAHSDAEFVVFFDCDHVPQPEFIERTLGYFRDSSLAFVQTPQVFYNTNSFQHRVAGKRSDWNEQTLFYECIQPGKNGFNASFFCGSGAMLRRSALDAVGGFATGTATEDIHTSLRLHSRGYRSLFVPERLAYGLAPEDFKEYHRQRVRWGAGSLGLLFRSADSPLCARGLTIMQRLSYIDSTMGFLHAPFRLLYYLLGMAFLIGVPSSLVVLGGLAPLYWGFQVYSVLLRVYFGRGTYHPIYSEQYHVADIPAHVLALKGILAVQRKFGVSVKLKNRAEGSGLAALIVVLTVGMFSAGVYGTQRLIGELAPDPWLLLSTVLGVTLIWTGLNLGVLASACVFFVRHARARRLEQPPSASLALNAAPFAGSSPLTAVASASGSDRRALGRSASGVG